VLVLAAIVAAIVNHYPEVIWLPWVNETLILTVIYLSVTIFTGWGGQLSLCQLTFAAIGAYTTGQLSSSVGLPVLVGVAAGTVIAAAVGALLAVPTMRLSGIYLALATLAFALMFSNVIEPLAWVTGGSAVPQKVPRPRVGPVDFASDRTFLVLAAVACVAVCAVAVLVTKGTTGRYLSALRGSEIAAQAIGINPRTVRLLAFALSAAIAGLGGGLLATYREAARPVDFDYLTGLLVVASVVTLGSRTIEGAFNAALGVAVFGVVVFNDFLPWLLSSVQPWHEVDGISPQWLAVLFGLGAITYAKNPDGILAAFRRSSARSRHRRRRTGAPGDARPPAPAPDPVMTA
jgi:ABC-type branched-subunit amino acid transport system permease subunit